MKNSTQDLRLGSLGINKLANVYRNLPIAKLIENEVLNKEAKIGIRGSMMVDTGQYTGRSPQDKYFVDENSTTDHIWWGPVNKKVNEEVFDELYHNQLR